MIELPNTIIVNDKRLFKISKNAVDVGRRAAALEWSRRNMPELFQMRFDNFVFEGGVYVDRKGNTFPIHEDIVEDCFSDDAGYKWLSDFQKRCVEHPDRKYHVQDKLLNRLQIMDLALRTPALGMAI